MDLGASGVVNDDHVLGGVAILNDEGGYTTVSKRALHFTDVVPNFTEQVKQRDIA